MVALDVETGAERWGFKRAPLVASDRVYVGASTAGLFALPRGGRAQAR
jgi:hypothetical protein